MTAHLKLVAPKAEKRTIPRRRPNKELRTREHLTAAEVERLIAAAKGNREGHRDATMILLAYRHGLRAAELVDLRWDQVDFQHGTLFAGSRTARRPLIPYPAMNSAPSGVFKGRPLSRRSYLSPCEARPSRCRASAARSSVPHWPQDWTA
jgi:integrase